MKQVITREIPIEEYEKKYGMKIADGVHWKNGQFVYDSIWVYLKRNGQQIAWILIGMAMMVFAATR